MQERSFGVHLPAFGFIIQYSYYVIIILQQLYLGAVVSCMLVIVITELFILFAAFIVVFIVVFILIVVSFSIFLITPVLTSTPNLSDRRCKTQPTRNQFPDFVGLSRWNP
jgi:hypothetical protein